jgi:hypothetical protein
MTDLLISSFKLKPSPDETSPLQTSRWHVLNTPEVHQTRILSMQASACAVSDLHAGWNFATMPTSTSRIGRPLYVDICTIGACTSNMP